METLTSIFTAAPSLPPIEVANLLNRRMASLQQPSHQLLLSNIALGRITKRLVSYTTIAELTCSEANIPRWLFDQCKQHTATISENVALCLPLSDANCKAPSLSQIFSVIEDLASCPFPAQRALITSTWYQLNTPERVLFNRMLLGGFRSSIVKGLYVSDSASDATLIGTPHFGIETPSSILSAPIEMTAVLISVKRELHGMSYNFGVSRNGLTVPITSLSESAFSPSDRQLLNQHADNYTTEKFGPVRVVLPTIFATLRLHNISIATRKKSGLNVEQTETVRLESTAFNPSDVAVESMVQTALARISDVSLLAGETGLRR